MNRNPRQYTCQVLQQVEDGMLDKDYLISALLGHLSDADVHQCMLANDILIEDDEEVS